MQPSHAATPHVTGAGPARSRALFPPPRPTPTPPSPARATQAPLEADATAPLLTPRKRRQQRGSNAGVFTEQERASGEPFGSAADPRAHYRQARGQSTNSLVDQRRAAIEERKGARHEKGAASGGRWRSAAPPVPPFHKQAAAGGGAGLVGNSWAAVMRPSAEARAAAVRELGASKDEKAGYALCRALSDPALQVRLAAA